MKGPTREETTGEGGFQSKELLQSPLRIRIVFLYSQVLMPLLKSSITWSLIMNVIPFRLYQNPEESHSLLGNRHCRA